MSDARQVWKLAGAPRDRRELDDWARQNIKIGAWSPWEGDFTTERTPWIVAPLRALGRPGPKRVTLRGPAAGGKSTVAEVALCWIIDNAPGFTVWYCQDEDAAKEFAETRVNRFLDLCEAVKQWFPADRHKKRTQAMHMPHMSAVIQAANLGNVQSKHIRHMICDETHLWKPGMLAAAHKRTTRFAHNCTILELSTGSLEGDETDQSWKQGSRQEWQFFCPKCRRHHVPKWHFGRADAPGGVRWNPTAKRADGTWDHKMVSDSTVYQCPTCSANFEANAANAYLLNSLGEYTAQATDGMPNHSSFHWNSIASDFSELGKIAVEYIQAKNAVKRGTIELLKEFTQKKLAEAWKDETPTIQIADVASDYSLGDPWADEAIRLMAVDVQDTHFWAVVRAFSKDGRSRLVDAVRLESWEQVRALQTSRGVVDDCVFVDTGHRPDAVYTSCSFWGWFGVKGEKVPGGYLMPMPDGRKVRVMARWSSDLNNRAVEYYPSQLAKGSKNRCCNLFLVSDEMTAEVISNARAGRVAGWTVAKDAPEFYRSQMASMVHMSRPNAKTNETEWYWKEIGNAGNHLWDCERYLIAGAFLAGYYHFTE
jgi:hypothetical protein